jgi:hypothetical protein
VVFAVTMAAVWSPVLVMLQPHGGSAAVAANHRQYLQPAAEWFATLWRQTVNLKTLDGPLTAVGLGLAVLVPAVLLPLSRRHSTWNVAPSESDPTGTDAPGRSSSLDNARRRSSIFEVLQWSAVIAFLAAGAPAILPSSVVLGVAAICGIVLQLVRTPVDGQVSTDDDGGNSTAARSEKLASWLVAAWYLGLLAATPFYTPYPRLTLPWLMSAWLGTAALIGWAVRNAMRAATNPANAGGTMTGRGLTALLIVAAFAVSAWLIVQRFPARIVGWQDRTGIERIAAQIVEETSGLTAARGDVRAGLPAAIIYVYAEPALFFHLSAMAPDRIAAGPVTNLDFVHPRANSVQVPTYLVAGPHAEHTAGFGRQWEEFGPRFELVETYSYTPSDLVFLDNYDPRTFIDPEARPDERVRLYRIR